MEDRRRLDVTKHRCKVIRKDSFHAQIVVNVRNCSVEWKLTGGSGVYESTLKYGIK